MSINKEINSVKQDNNRLRREIHTMRTLIKKLNRELNELKKGDSLKLNLPIEDWPMHTKQTPNLNPTISMFIKTSKVQRSNYETMKLFEEEE